MRGTQATAATPYAAHLIAAAVAINLCVAAAAYWSLERGHREAISDATVAAENLSELLVRDIGGEYDNMDKSLLAVVDEYERQTEAGSVDTPALNALVARQQRRHPELVPVRITDSNGKVISHLDGPAGKPPINLGQREYFIRHRRDPQAGLVISEPLLSSIHGKPGIAFSRRLNRADGSFAGVAVAFLEAGWIDSRFTGLRLGPGGSIALRDDELRLIVRHPLNENTGGLGTSKTSVDFQRALQLNPKAGTYAAGGTSIDGVLRLHAYRKHARYPFYINVGIANSDYLAEWHYDSKIIVAIVIAFALTTGLGARFLLVAWRRREQAQAALMLSETRFHQALDASPVASAIANEQGIFTYLNPAFVRLFGYTLADLPTLDTWWLKAYPDPAYRKPLVSAWQKAFMDAQQSGIATIPFEVRITNKRGEVLEILGAATPLDAKPNGAFLAMLFDITERKQIEARLEQTASLLRATLESTADGILTVDSADRIISFNQRYVEMWRIPAAVVDTADNASALAFVADQLADPAGFVEKARDLLQQPEKIDIDLLEFKDGRIFERYSMPLHLRGAIAGRVLSFRDVSQSRLAEAALQSSERRYRSLFVNSQLVMLVIDPDSQRIVDANPAACSYYGYARERMLTMAISDINTMSEERIQAQMTLAKAEAKRHFNFQHRTASGELRDVEVFSGPIEIDDKPYLMSIVVDISESKQLELALKATAQRFQLAMEATSDGVWEWNLVEDRTYFSPSYHRMLGFEPGAFPMVSQSWIDLIHPQDHARVLASCQDCIENRRPDFSFEYRLKTEGGAWKWILGRGKASSRDERGRALTMVGTHVDITARKQAEEALRLSNEHFATIAGTVPVVLYDYVLDADGHGRFTYMNSRSQKIIGCDAAAIVSDPDNFWRLIHPDDLPRVHAEDVAANQTMKKLSTDFRIVTPGGKEKWVHAESRPGLERPGEPVIWSGYIQDISRQKMQQRELEQQVMERTAQLRAMAMELSTTEERERQVIAHQLHDGLCQTLAVAKLKLSAIDTQRKVSPWGSDLHLKLSSIETLLDDADQAARSLSLQLSSSILHKLGLVPALEWLAEEMQRVHHLRVHVHNHGVPQQLDAAVRNPVFHAVRELLINVAKHARVEVAELALTVASDHLIVSVTDSGVGFIPDDSAIPSARGGYGLFSVRERIGFIGGDVQIDSAPEDGTVVVLSVPIEMQGDTAR